MSLSDQDLSKQGLIGWCIEPGAVAPCTVVPMFWEKADWSLPFRIIWTSARTPRHRILPDAALQADRDQFLGFHGKLHRKLLYDFLDETVDDQSHGLFRIQSALQAIEHLIIGDL